MGQHLMQNGATQPMQYDARRSARHRRNSKTACPSVVAHQAEKAGGRAVLWAVLGALICLAWPVVALAQQEPARPGLLAAGGALDNPDPDVVATVGAGLKYHTAYPGASELDTVPLFLFRLDYIRFGGGFEFSSGDAVGFREGFGLRGSARFIGERYQNDYPELQGLRDINWTMELGLGLGYEQQGYRVFGDARYGFFGHDSWVGQLGADAIFRPVRGLTVTFGPRVDLGTDKFVDTYFGVSPAEAAASQFNAFSPSGGVVSAGLNLEAFYQIDERWGFQGRVAWDRLLNDAASSPITQFGSPDQYRVELAVTRRISIDF